jgi:hypothetical protein
MAEGLDKALREEVCTKADLTAATHALRDEIAPLKTDIAVLKWMLGFVLAMNTAIILKLFIH